MCADDISDDPSPLALDADDAVSDIEREVVAAVLGDRFQHLDS